MEKELFDLVESLDQNHSDSIGVHESGFDDSDGEMSYRVYHQNGYCFDIKRQWDEDTEEMYFFYYAEWDGFKELPLKKAIELIKNEGFFV